MSRALETLGKYKYLLLLLLLGLILLLWPTGGGGGAAPDEGRTEAEARLEAVLGEVSGAGRVSVLYSDEGVAVVCEGAPVYQELRHRLHHGPRRQDQRQQAAVTPS